MLSWFQDAIKNVFKHQIINLTPPNTGFIFLVLVILTSESRNQQFKSQKAITQIKVFWWFLIYHS